MESCYEYFDCQKKSCVMYGRKNDKPCWETENTECFFPPLVPLIKEVNHKERCDYCLYKHHVLKDNITQNCLSASISYLPEDKI